MPDHEPQPHGSAPSELAAFGEDLRREREIRGISLKEISDATKISRRFLEALERNDHRTLPAPVFTRGFVREYARYVGLNAEEMVNRYNFAAANDDRIEKPPTVAKYAAVPPKDISPKPPPKRGIPPAFARIDRNGLGVFVIVLALAAVAYWAIHHKRNERESTDTTGTVPAISTTRAAIPVMPVIPPPQPQPQDDSTLRMTIASTADSWVTLEADGKTVFNDSLASGEMRSFEAGEEFRFRTIGNAAGITLTLNGTAVPPLGSDGQVIKNRVYDREALATLRAEAAGRDNR